MASNGGPARQAVKEASRTLLHWSSAVSAVAVVIAAHWLAASGGAVDHAGLVYGTSFVVFALLLPPCRCCGSTSTVAPPACRRC